MNQPDPITFDVLGTPAPQGSKAFMGLTRAGRGILRESSANVRPWRQDVAAAALATGMPLTHQPVALTLTFRFSRPRAHLSARGGLRPSAPSAMATRPDLDKLVRSTLDALTGTILHDDSQVTQLTAAKRYCCASTERPGALITVIILS